MMDSNELQSNELESASLIIPITQVYPKVQNFHDGTRTAHLNVR